jgi:uncharacterized protein (DUF305 family)
MAAVLVGCGGSSKEAGTATPEPVATVNVVQPGAPGEPSKRVDPSKTPAAVAAVAADADFMRKMIHHHNQALTMTAWVPEKGANTSIRLMAKRMEVSQTDEIALMQQWLKKQGLNPDEQHTDMNMPGMLSPEQLKKLETAQGKDFDRLFLKYMTQHHQGAIQMVADLYNAGGGGETEINQFAMHVDSDQGIEIQRMAELAGKL